LNPMRGKELLGKGLTVSVCEEKREARRLVRAS
jgi:hypothetical protein